MVILLLGAPWLVYALAVPALVGHVNDVAHALAPKVYQDLENRLRAYEQVSQQQFAVLILPSLEGDSLEDFSLRVVESWRLGKAGRDDGLLLVLALKERKMRIEVGYGLEGKITDLLSKRIMLQILRPALKRGDLATGLSQSLEALMQAASGKELHLPAAPEDDPRAQAEGAGAIVLLFLILMLFFGPGVFLPFLLGSGFGGGRGGRGGFGGGGASGGW